MINSIFYYILLFIIIIFYCINLINNIKKSPKRVKLLFSILMILAIIKNITIVMVSLFKDPSHINIFKTLCFSDLFYVPALLIVVFYIFWRNNDFNFNFIMVEVVIMFIGYILLMFSLSFRFIVFLNYGYAIEATQHIFNLIFIFMMIYLLVRVLFSKKCIRTNHRGIGSIVIVLIAYIIEYSMGMCNFTFYPYTLIAEILLLFIVNFSINSFVECY